MDYRLLYGSFAVVLVLAGCSTPPPLELVNMLAMSTDFDDVRYARGHLVDLGEPAVPLLIAALEDDETRNKEWVAEVLYAMGPAASGACEALVREATRQKIGPQNLMMIGALARIGEASLPYLKPALRGDSNSQEVALLALSLMDPSVPLGSVAPDLRPHSGGILQVLGE